RDRRRNPRRPARIERRVPRGAGARRGREARQGRRRARVRARRRVAGETPVSGFWSDSVPEETLSREETQKVLRRLFAMLRPQRGAIVIATLVLMAQAAALSAGPLLVRYGIDQGIRDRDAGALNLAVVVYLGLALLG